MRGPLTAAVAALTVAGGCGDDGPGRTPTTPLDSDGTHLRDDRGRIALLHGVNARVEGVFDVTFDDGRVPVEEVPGAHRRRQIARKPCCAAQRDGGRAR